MREFLTTAFSAATGSVRARCGDLRDARSVYDRISIIQGELFVIPSFFPFCSSFLFTFKLLLIAFPHKMSSISGVSKPDEDWCSMIDTKNIESIVCALRSYLFGGALYFGGPLRRRSIRGSLFSRRLMKFLQGYLPLSVPPRLPFRRRG